MFRCLICILVPICRLISWTPPPPPPRGNCILQVLQKTNETPFSSLSFMLQRFQSSCHLLSLLVFFQECQWQCINPKFSSSLLKNRMFGGITSWHYWETRQNPGRILLKPGWLASMCVQYYCPGVSQGYYTSVKCAVSVKVIRRRTRELTTKKLYIHTTIYISQNSIEHYLLLAN